MMPRQTQRQREQRARPAIPAARSLLGEAAIYWLLARPALWNSFDAVRAQVVGRLPRPADGPLICYFNHPGWWDLYMTLVVRHELLQRRFAFYGMMEEKQLRAYRFFTWIGAFSVDRHNRSEAARSVAYISHLLRLRRSNALCIFPQGTITPNDRRPLVCFPGIAHIVRRVGGALLCPVALRYEFRGEERPEAYIRFGPVHRAAAPADSAGIGALTGEVCARLTEGADALRTAVLADDMQDFRVLLRGRSGINRAFDWLRGR